jgi:hypothetical protein
METRNLDKVRKLDTANHGLAMVVSDRGNLCFIDDVRAAYALDIEAAVAEARRDERRKCFEEVRDEMGRQEYMLQTTTADVFVATRMAYAWVRSWAIRRLSTATDAAQPAPGKETP